MSADKSNSSGQAGALSHIQAILFDLDGTISDNSIGITGCIRYALKELGRPAPDPAKLHWCIGPTLRSSFRILLSHHDDLLAAGTSDELRVSGPAAELFSTDQVEEGVRLYRVRYAEFGWSENSIYPLIPELLSGLARSGRTLAVTTTKARDFARRIVEHFSLDSYLKEVYGPELDGKLSSKTALVEHAIRELGLDPARTAIVGDRDLDIIGGKAHGIKTVGVGYGFGTVSELQDAGADHIVSSVIELIGLFE